MVRITSQKTSFSSNSLRAATLSGCAEKWYPGFIRLSVPSLSSYLWSEAVMYLVGRNTTQALSASLSQRKRMMARTSFASWQRCKWNGMHTLAVLLWPKNDIHCDQVYLKVSIKRAPFAPRGETIIGQTNGGARPACFWCSTAAWSWPAGEESQKPKILATGLDLAGLSQGMVWILSGPLPPPPPPPLQGLFI